MYPPWMMPNYMMMSPPQMPPDPQQGTREMIKFLKWQLRQEEVKNKAKEEKDKGKKDGDKPKNRTFNYLESFALACFASIPIAVLGMVMAIELGQGLKIFLNATLK
jgi:hypothetical protein